MEGNETEKARLNALAEEIIKAFIQETFKNAEVVAEMVILTPVLQKDTFRRVLEQFIGELNVSVRL